MDGSLLDVRLPDGFFKPMRFATTGVVPEQVISLLTKNGARHDKEICGLSTHCIVGENPNEDVIEEATDIQEIPVLHYKWVTLSVKCKKLLSTNALVAKGGAFFKGVVVTTSGLGRSDVERIWAMVTLQGGTFRARLDLNRCTHVVCAKPSGKKYEAALTRPGLKIVTPDWVVDCCRRKGLLDVSRYHPKLLVPKRIIRAPVMKDSLASITGFDDDLEESTNAAKPSKELLQQLTGKLPWLEDKSVVRNQPPPQPRPVFSVSSAPTMATSMTPTQPQTLMVRPGMPQTVRLAGPQQVVVSQAMRQPGVHYIQRPMMGPRPGDGPRAVVVRLNTGKPGHETVVQQITVPPGTPMRQQFVRIQKPGQGVEMAGPGHLIVTTTQGLGPGVVVHPVPMGRKVNQASGEGPPGQQMIQSADGLAVTIQGTNVNGQQVLIARAAPRQPVGMHQSNIPPHLQSQIPGNQRVVQGSQAMNPVQMQVHQKLVQQRLAQQQHGQQIQGQQMSTQVDQGQQVQVQVQPPQVQAPQGVVVPRSPVPVRATTPGGVPVTFTAASGPQQAVAASQTHVGLQQGQQHAEGPITQASGGTQTTGGPETWQQQQQPPRPQVLQQSPQMRPRWPGPGTVVQQPGQVRAQAVATGTAPQVAPRQQVVITRQQLEQMEPGKREFILRQWQKHQEQLMQQQVRLPAPPPGLTPQQQQAFLQQQRLKLMQQQQIVTDSQGNQRMIIHRAVQPGQHIITRPAGPGMQQTIRHPQQVQQVIKMQPSQGVQTAQVWQTGAQQPGQPQPQQGPPQTQQIPPIQMQQGAAPALNRPALLQQHLENPPQPQMPQTSQAPRPPGPTYVQQGVQHVVTTQQRITTIVSGESPGVVSSVQTIAQAPPVGVSPSQVHPVGVTNEAGTATSFGMQTRPQGVLTSPAGVRPTHQVVSPQQGQQLIMMTPGQPRATHPQQIVTPRLAGRAIHQQVAFRATSPAGATAVRPIIAQQQQVTVMHQPHASPQTTTVAASPAPAIPRPQFLGHDFNVRLPGEVCLLCCVFHIVGYDYIEPDVMAKYRERVKRYGGEICDAMEPRVNVIITDEYERPIVEQALREGKRVVTLQWLNDIISSKKKVVPPWEAVHVPPHFRAGRDKPLKQISLAVAGFQGPERQKVRRMIFHTGAKYTGVFSKHNFALICKKPDSASQKVRKAREWKVPIVNLQWLSELVMGHFAGLKFTESLKFQDFSAEDPFKIDYSLVPELMAPWKFAIQLTNEAIRRYKCGAVGPASVGQSSSTGSAPMGVNGPARTPTASSKAKRKLDTSKENDTMTTPKRPKLDSLLLGNEGSDIEVPRVAFSASDETIKNELSNLVSSLGGVVVTNVQEATHLVMDTIEHTQKFFSAVAGCCRYIVTSHWIKECFSKRRFLPEESFVPYSEEYNRTYGLPLAEVMSRPNRSSFLEGRTFFLTPSIRPSKGYIRDVIAAAGGTVTKVRPKGSVLKEQNDSRVNGTCSYRETIIVTCPDDYYLVDDVIRAGVDMYCPLLVLDGVLGQRLQFEKFRLQPPKVETDDSAASLEQRESTSS